MCGFVIGNIFADEYDFIRSLRLIDHRGKDWKGVNHSVKTNTWIGHNRLSIQGLNKESNQPMIKSHYTMVYNGELWRSMDSYKSKFELKSGSDTELLLSMFNSEQEDCIKSLDGMFGFAVLDEDKNQLTFARDFMGRIPLYYYKVGKKIVVASELKSITDTLSVNASDISLVEPGCYNIYLIMTQVS